MATSLQDLLKYLSSKGLAIPDAIKCAGPLVKSGYTDPVRLKTLNESTLTKIGISDSSLSKKLLSAVGSRSSKPTTASSSKRKRDNDLDTPLPLAIPTALNPSEDPELTTEDLVVFDLDEELDEEVLAGRSVVINRAPMMTAWSVVVCERLGFKRREALSLAQAFTDLNAKSKGASLGIFPASVTKNQGGGPSQPYVDLMGRKIPVFSLQNEEWRAVIAGEMIKPSAAYGYLQRSFKQQMGSVIGALRLLAESYPAAELSKKGIGLYYEFRPNAVNWGERSTVKLSSILDLRLSNIYADNETTPTATTNNVAATENTTGEQSSSNALFGEDHDDDDKKETDIKQAKVTNDDVKSDDEDDYFNDEDEDFIANLDLDALANNNNGGGNNNVVNAKEDSKNYNNVDYQAEPAQVIAPAIMKTMLEEEGKEKRKRSKIEK